MGVVLLVVLAPGGAPRFGAVERRLRDARRGRHRVAMSRRARTRGSAQLTELLRLRSAVCCLPMTRFQRPTTPRTTSSIALDPWCTSRIDPPTVAALRSYTSRRKPAAAVMLPDWPPSLLNRPTTPSPAPASPRSLLATPRGQTPNPPSSPRRREFIATRPGSAWDRAPPNRMRLADENFDLRPLVRPASRCATARHRKGMWLHSQERTSGPPEDPRARGRPPRRPARGRRSRPPRRRARGRAARRRGRGGGRRGASRLASHARQELRSRNCALHALHCPAREELSL